MRGKIVEFSNQKPITECKLAFHSKSQGWHIGFYEEKTIYNESDYFYEHQECLQFYDVTHWFFIFDQE